MKQSDAKKLFIEYAGPDLEQKGFKLQKTRTTEAIYYKKKENGYEVLGVSTANYYPEVVFKMGTQKRLNVIEEILWDINQVYNLGLSLSKEESWTLSFQGNRLLEREIELSGVAHREDERGVQASTKILMNFIEGELLPAYDLFDDIREIDNTINGEGDHFWEDDIGNSKPFKFGGRFFERRLIIAKLCNNPSYDIIVDKYFTYIEQAMEKQTGEPYIFDRDDLTLPVPATIQYLKENVSPIY